MHGCPITTTHGSAAPCACDRAQLGGGLTRKVRRVASDSREQIAARGVFGGVFADLGLPATLGVIDHPAVAPLVDDESLVQVLSGSADPIGGLRVSLRLEDCLQLLGGQRRSKVGHKIILAAPGGGPRIAGASHPLLPPAGGQSPSAPSSASRTGRQSSAPRPPAIRTSRQSSLSSCSIELKRSQCP